MARDEPRRAMQLDVEHFPLKEAFTISRGSKTAASVVVCRLQCGTAVGLGECVPYARYGETIESVLAAIESVRAALEGGVSRELLQTLLPPGAARNAVDCALWDLEAKASGVAAWQAAGLALPGPLVTAYTLSLGEPGEMAAAAAAQAHRPLLKIKLGTGDDSARLRAVRAAAPDCVLVVDANEGWRPDTLAEHLAVAAGEGVALVEQPLPEGEDQALAEIAHPVPICADESSKTAEGLESLLGRYDAVNIKLDKTGGLTGALAMRKRADALGLKVMVGCMVGTSLGMAPAALVAQGAAFTDLDGPLLLARDREPGLTYEGSTLLPPVPALWG